MCTWVVNPSRALMIPIDRPRFPVEATEIACREKNRLGVRSREDPVVVFGAQQAGLQGQGLGVQEHLVDSAAGLDGARDRQLAVEFEPHSGA
jgi:hypothetical protein